VRGKDAMANERTGARKVRKIRASRDGWKERAAKKQQEIKRLRGTVRDLTLSRDHWKTRVSELEQQVETLQPAYASTSCVFPASFFFGG
jgi:chromosome segregation ATPase